MIARGGIDDGVRRARFFAQQRRIVERADHRRDAMGRDHVSFGPVANQAANPMACGDQRHRRRAADIAVCTGEENLHGTFLSPPLRKRAPARQIVLARALASELCKGIHEAPSNLSGGVAPEAPWSSPRHSGEHWHSLVVQIEPAGTTRTCTFAGIFSGKENGFGREYRRFNCKLSFNAIFVCNGQIHLLQWASKPVRLHSNLRRL